MLLAVVVLLAALVIGWLRRGSLDNLGQLRLHHARLVVIALVFQVLGGLAGGWRYPAGLAISAILVGFFLAYNRAVAGLVLVGSGLVLNALVVVLNGAMPVSLDAFGHAGISSQDILTGDDPRHEIADASTHLEVLSDVIPVVFPYRPEVVSPGDVLVAAGIGQLIVTAMVRRPA